MVLVDLRQKVLEVGIQLVVTEIASEVIEALAEPLPKAVIDAFAAIRLDIVVNTFAKVIIRQLRAGHSDHGEFLREQSRSGQIVERGDQHAPRQISSRAKNYHDAGIALLADTRRRRGRLGLFR